MSEITKQEYKNPKQVRDYWKKIQRAYRARKKQEKLEASAPRLDSTDTLAASSKELTTND